jgi:hypothetical protein
VYAWSLDTPNELINRKSYVAAGLLIYRPAPRQCLLSFSTYVVGAYLEGDTRRHYESCNGCFGVAGPACVGSRSGSRGPRNRAPGVWERFASRPRTLHRSMGYTMAMACKGRLTNCKGPVPCTILFRLVWLGRSGHRLGTPCR